MAAIKAKPRAFTMTAGLTRIRGAYKRSGVPPTHTRIEQGSKRLETAALQLQHQVSAVRRFH